VNEDTEPKAVMSLTQCRQLLRELQELRLRLEALEHSVAAYVTDVEDNTG
jgi:hypothetical protein